MILNFSNSIYSKLVTFLSKGVSDKYWLGKRLAHQLPATQFKRLKIRKDSLIYGKTYIGEVSTDNQYAIIKDEDMLKSLNKSNPTFFHDDFLELSQMVYFVFCYLFVPDDSENHFNNRWAVFYKFLNHDKITSFGKTSKITQDLLQSLNNGNITPEFAPTLDNFRTTPPILSKFGVVFEKDGGEYNLLHYTIKLPRGKDHISLVLLEQNGQKFYKLTKLTTPNIDLMDKVSYHKYFKFDMCEYSKYSTASDFIGEFSMLLVKSIDPNYNEDFHPTAKNKMIFDMLHY